MSRNRSPPKVFLREATGLVREFSTFQLVGANWSSLTLYTGLIFYISLAFIFPLANNVLSIFLTVLGFVPLAAVISMAVVAAPRAAIDYVFVSRSLHPAIGFMVSMVISLWFAFYAGAFASWIFTLGLSPMFSVMGSVLNSPQLLNLSTAVSDPTLVVIGGAVYIAFAAAIAVVARRLQATLNAVLAILGMLSLAAIVVLLLATPNQAFQAAFNTYSLRFTSDHDYYNTIIHTAQTNGLGSGFSLGDTIAMLPFGAFIFLFTINILGVTGEIKRPARTIVSSSVISVFLAGLLAVVGVAATSYSMSFGFINAAGLVYASSLSYALPVAPTLNFLASLITNNLAVIFIVNMGLVFTNAAVVFNYFLNVPREFMAIAFDRVFPERFADVSDKYHSPHIAVIVSAIPCLITLVIFTYFGSLLASLSATAGQLLFAYLVISLAGIFFPFSKRTKSVYEMSAIKKSILGIPVITIFGILGLLFEAWLGYEYLVVPAYATNTTVDLLAMFLVPILCVVYYFLRRAYLRGRGLNLDLVFEQIPPE